jgi:hypothetical protein
MFNEAFESRNVDEAFYHHKIISYVVTSADHIYLPSSIGLTPSPICESTQIPILDQQISFIEVHTNIGSNQHANLRGVRLPMF